MIVIWDCVAIVVIMAIVRRQLVDWVRGRRLKRAELRRTGSMQIGVLKLFSDTLEVLQTLGDLNHVIYI